MKYKEHLPHSSLQDYIKCFWILEREHTADNPTEEVTPDAFVELILNFGTPYVLQTEGREDREMPSAFLVGLQQKPLMFRSDGTVRLVSTRFYAWGTLPFFETQSKSSPNLGISLGNEWHDLFAKLKPLVEADNYDDAVAGMEDFLIAKLLVSSIDLKQIESAAKMLHHQKGQFRIAELADYCNLSERQLQRVFRDSVGVSPKLLARTIRFEEIRRRLMFEPEANLTELAYEFGYTDQAHFIRDFKEFAGRTPGEFAAQMRAFQAVFQDENVVFLQFQSSGSE
jgi:AraC-like DNA-binding protein